MIVIRKEKPVVKFEELASGAVFEYAGEIFMKTESSGGTSAVDLVFGCFLEIEKDTLVKKILNATLTMTE